MTVIVRPLIAEIEIDIDECDGIIAEIELEEIIEVDAPLDIEEEFLYAEIENNGLVALIEEFPNFHIEVFDAIYEKLENKNQPNGYAGLNGDAKIPANLLAYSYYYEDVALNATQILNKKIILSKIPIFPESVIVQPDGALPQKYGVDFEVVSNEIRWNGLGLDGFLTELGEVIRVLYKSED